MECGVEGVTFRMGVATEWERTRAESLRRKEPDMVRWILDTFRPGDTLYDIGANVGLFAIFAAVANPDGTVVAAEPMAGSFHRLCENAALNGLQNFRPFCVAVSSSNGLGTLNLTSLESASSMHSLDDTGAFEEPIVLRAGIGTVTVDTLASVAGPPTLIKVDVDGAEDAVLAGATSVLADPRLRSLIVEFNWHEGDAVQRRDEPLLRAGFVAQSSGPEYDRGPVHWQNTVYVRR